MDKLKLHDVTLIGVDCLNVDRLRYAADISSEGIDFGSIKLLSSIPSSDSRVVKISPIGSIEEYSNFIIKRLNEYVETNFALIFQGDGFVLNPQAWTNEFFKYDYIGAPMYHMGEMVRVGNGGFSLRSKKLLDWVSNNWELVDGPIHPEDIFICYFARPFLEKAGLIFSPEDIANRFAIEGGEHGVVWNGEFGFHGLGYTDISKWIEMNPEHQYFSQYKLGEYTQFMKKYKKYDGTVHTLRFSKEQMENYEQLSKNKKDYEIRVTQEKFSNDLSLIREGNTVVFKKAGFSFQEFPIHTFERKVKKIEHFNSLVDLRYKYPKEIISFSLDRFKLWQRPLARLSGDIFIPKMKPLTIIWFD